MVLVNLPYGFQFLNIPYRRTGAVRVDIIHRSVYRGQCLLHATHRAFAGGGHHVVTVRGGAIAHQLRVDFCAPGSGVLELFYDQHATATGDDEAIAVDVIGAGGPLRGIVVLGGQRSHGIEQAAERPV